MNKVLVYILLVFIALGGCKKVDLEPPVSTDSVFFTENIFIDGEALDWTAGDNNLYMFTEYSIDNQGLHTLTGRFASDSGCQIDCEKSLTFSLRSNYVDPNSFLIEQAIDLGEMPFFRQGGNSFVGYNYSFSAELVDSIFNTTPDSFFWTISDSIDTVTTIEATPNFESIGSNDVNVRVDISHNAPNSCISYIEKTIFAGGNDNCNLQIQVDPPNNPVGGVYTVIPSFGSGPVFGSTFTWTPPNIFGPSDTIQVDPLLIDSIGGAIGLLAENPNLGCSTELEICIGSFMGQSISSFGVPKINFSVEEIVDSIGAQLGTAIIEYQDGNEVYSTKYGDNPAPNYFVVNSIEDYENNENGEKTKRLNVSFETKLWHENGIEFKTISGSAFIGIAYPD